MSGGSDWDADAIYQLRTMWADGKTTLEIARVMHRSKNFVVGKAHRLDLPPRQSPIIRDRVRAPLKPPRAPRVTLPIPPQVSTTTFTALPPARVEQQMPVRAAAAEGCCWPIGEPGTRAFRYCEAAAPRGKPYCDRCSKKAYVRRVPDAEHVAA